MLELLLVLALLVTVAALAMPSVGVTLDNHRLRAAGEQMRTAWAKARVRAMDSGKTYAFRHELSGSRYVIEPWLQQDDYLESSQLTINGASPSGANDATNAPIGLIQDELPENVSFVSSQSVEDSRSLVTAQVGSSMLATDAQWSAPVFFYPDGTASTSRLRLINTRNHALEISLRGLTGVVSVKEVAAGDLVSP